MFARVIPLGTLCVLLGLIIVGPTPGFTEETKPIHPQGSVLSWEEARIRTLARGPEIMATTEELRAIEAEAALAGRLPNPELSVTLENVAGEGAYQDSDAAELTIELSQSLELGGKRRLRQEAAELGRQLAANGQKLASAGVLAVARQRFIAVLSAQEKLALTKEQAAVAARALDAAEERIRAGKAPAIDRTRLKSQVSLATLGATQAERSLLSARQALAAVWGDAQPDFEQVEGDLGSLPEVPALSEVEASLEQSTEALNRRITTKLRSIELEQAMAGRVPDPRVTVGWRQFEESEENAWLFGVSLPLPVFSYGQDAVTAASSRYHGARAREASEYNQARSTLRGAWQTLADARAEAEVLDGQVVPAAAEGFAAAEFGYRAGKFGLLELLDAQRALFEVRQQQLAARTDCHLAAIELQRLLQSP